ncbi:MAG: peroxiredoxin-like family protein [Mycobacteriales bacterium]|jgi:peroxiredoxin
MPERIKVGDRIGPRTLAGVRGETAPVPDPAGLLHVQFRRFAGCPVCNLHLRSVVRRHDEIVAAGVREVVLFHAPDEDLRPHVADMPFPVVGDPDKRLYREFGVESSRWALVDPRVWGAILRGVAVSLWSVVRRRGAVPKLLPHGGRNGLPADFLIAPDGTVLAARYGTHIYDQWSVDELLELARRPVPPGEAA